MRAKGASPTRAVPGFPMALKRKEAAKSEKVAILDAGAQVRANNVHGQTNRLPRLSVCACRLPRAPSLRSMPR